MKVRGSVRMVPDVCCQKVVNDIVLFWNPQIRSHLHVSQAYRVDISQNLVISPYMYSTCLTRLSYQEMEEMAVELQERWLSSRWLEFETACQHFIALNH